MDKKITLSLLLLTLTGFCHESLLGGELRCRCLQTASGLMSPKHLVHVEIIPKGPQCGTVEVMASKPLNSFSDAIHIWFAFSPIPAISAKDNHDIGDVKGHHNLMGKSNQLVIDESSGIAALLLNSERHTGHVFLEVIISR
ncbi:hypothetical protein UY3_09915 [Chelonia mydas]|uniref:Uncharacterized protein n=1 Tax=Chelonia mydas TaxID=8469 RepID=M7B4W7_CHEMY|nr:hypothetical protein UY3_09915 [Chelonia mydas]